MAVEGIEYTKGVSRAKIICDDCGRSECIPCAYHGPRVRNEPGAPNVNQARAKAINMNWSYIKNKLRCPSCTAKRKVVPMKSVSKPKAVTPEGPNPKQWVAIVNLLAEVYDMDAGRYMQGDTDDTVADVLKVMPGWVAEIREDKFGPSGENEDMDSLKSDLDDFLDEATKRLNKMTDDSQKLVEAIETARGFRTRMDKIGKAVGARTLKKAGVN